MGTHAQGGRRGVARSWRRISHAPRQGAGFLMFIWFLLMVVSVGLMYYYYLKSERLERELRLLREKHGLLASEAKASSSPELVVADGVAPETFAAESTASASSLPAPARQEEVSANVEQEGGRAASQGAATPSAPAVAPSPIPTPTPPALATATPQVAPVRESEQMRPAQATPTGSSGTAAPSSRLRSSPRAGRVNSAYDIPQRDSNR